MEDQIQHARLMFYLVVTLFAGWTAAVAWMNGKRIFWDYDKFPDEHEAGKGSDAPKT